MIADAPSKDLFSKQADTYARFRPTYPEALFKHLASLAPGKNLAWDCATGSGQAARELAVYFKKVVATDFSKKQLANAEPRPNIEYREAPANDSGLDASSADLITVAQAFHWFAQGPKGEAFFKEAKRVLKPNGILAVWCYELARIDAEVDQAVLKLYDGVLGAYWEKERKLVEKGYAGLEVPFEEIQTPRFEMRAEWTFEHLLGYLGTWSALQTFIGKNGFNPLETHKADLKKAWGSAALKPVRWDLALRAFKKN